MQRPARVTKLLSATAACRVANEHALFHYPTMCTSAPAHRLTLSKRDVWIVPIVLTSPGWGVVGTVGVVAVDSRTGEVVGSTSRADVVLAVKRVQNGKEDALEAAFLRARET